MKICLAFSALLFAVATEAPAAPTASVAAALESLEKATADVETRSEAQPGVITQGEVARLQEQVEALETAAPTLPVRQQEAYAVALGEQADRLREGAATTDLNKARVGISTSLSDLTLMNNTIASANGGASPGVVLVNAFALAAGAKVPGYAIGAYRVGKPGDKVGFPELSKSNAPTSLEFVPGKYRFFAAQGGKQHETPLPIDIGGYGKKSQIVEIPIE